MNGGSIICKRIGCFIIAKKPRMRAKMRSCKVGRGEGGRVLYYRGKRCTRIELFSFFELNLFDNLTVCYNYN